MHTPESWTACSDGASRFDRLVANIDAEAEGAWLALWWLFQEGQIRIAVVVWIPWGLRDTVVMMTLTGRPVPDVELKSRRLKWGFWTCVGDFSLLDLDPKLPESWKEKRVSQMMSMSRGPGHVSAIEGRPRWDSSLDGEMGQRQKVEGGSFSIFCLSPLFSSRFPLPSSPRPIDSPSEHGTRNK